MKKFTLLLFISLLLFTQQAVAQSSNIDPAFNSGDLGFGYAQGASATAMAVQSDGKIIIVGDFTVYNTTSINRVARLNADGSLDTTFKVGTGANNLVNAVAVLSTGKIIIAGKFISYNGTTVPHIARLNTDGTLDLTYMTGTGPDGFIDEIARQSDDKILIGGDYDNYNGTARNSIARLNTDGTLDTSFDPGTGPAELGDPRPHLLNPIRSIAIQTDGKIIVGSYFSEFNGVAKNDIVRLNSNGSLDGTFSSGTGADGLISDIVIQTDGKILIAGSYTTYNGTSRNRIARLSSTGALDATFNPGTGADAAVSKIAVQTDGKILISGGFTGYNSTTTNSKLIRVSSTGILDATFKTPSSVSSTDILILGSGKILTSNPVFCINTDGSRDYSFNKGTGVASTVKAIAIQPDKKIIIAGAFETYYGSICIRIARLNLDGTLDSTFNPGLGANNTIEALKIQSDGKIIIGGSFTSFNGIAVGNIARLNSNGTLDGTFTSGTGANNTIYELDTQNDGKIIIAGMFTSFNGTTTNRIARLNTNGTLDATFNIGTGANNTVSAIKIQKDDQIIVGGSFTTYNGTSINRIMRLNTDGTLDGTFTVGTGCNAAVEVITIQNDEKIIIGGSFNSYNGATKVGTTRINSDGTLDLTFNPVNFGAVYAIATQFDDKIILAGSFTTPSKRIARLKPDGTADPSFNIGTAANNIIYAMALQNDAKILIGGDFTSYDVTGRNRVARLLNANISTGTIVGSPFCAGETLSVPFTAIGSFNSGNVFTAQLSNGSGSFASPINIGTLSALTSDTISALIPSNTLTGIGYRIRIISSDIAAVGNDNGSDFTINSLPSGTVSGQTNVNCFGGGNGSAIVSPSGGHSPYIYFWAPYGGFSNSASNLSAGSYTVTITDSRNCTASVPVTISQPTKLQLSLTSQVNVSCYGGSNGSAVVSATGGSGGNSYLWTPGGATTNSVTGLSAVSHVVQVSDLNGCTDNLTINITQPTLLTGAVTSTTNTSCSLSSDGSAGVSANGGTVPYTYNWQPSGGTNSTAGNLLVGTYTVNITDNKGCLATVPISIKNIVPLQEVCVVTADSATGNYNIVIWEKPIDVSNIDSFYIYREITTNNFQKIAAVHRDSLSIYNDYSANPNSTSYKYKIKVLDTCGTIGEFGRFHSSIHLQYLGNGNFLWTVYQIENTPNQVSDYNFYRDNTGTGNFVFLQLIPGGNNSYTDVNYASYPTARYRVDVNWLGGHVCSPSRGSISTTRSNIKSSGSVATSLQENTKDQLHIYPNPATESITIQYPAGKNDQLQIMNALGQSVYNEELINGDISKEVFTKQIDVSSFSKGIYIIHLKTENGDIFKKLTIQ